ncbi:MULTISPECIES: RNA polymerase sigma factor [Streptacidiphilus]|uniref:RNA polymerase sigma factor n=1 Tax=Streptacidiphilus cavernicola TaxID=3342716 RepID=A0ABV6V1K0_9ACTN|nr:sigma-70 family RNA polymerase sigma factor [Streptacidiphilus jeojiense]
MVSPAERQAAIEVFEGLYRTHAHRLLAVAATVSLDFAGDGLQHAFEEAWKRILAPEGARVDNWAAWLRKTALRRVVQECIRARRDVALEGIEPSAAEPSIDDLVVIRQKFEGTLKQMAELPPRQREALGLCFLAGFTSRQTAEIMNVEVSTVRNLVHQARRSLLQVERDDNA